MRGIAAAGVTTGSKVAGSAGSGTVNATVDIRFGARSGIATTSGPYTAALTFEVVTPNL